MNRKIAYGVFPEVALCALVGIPADSIWATTVTGYRANVWQEQTEDECYSHWPICSRVFSNRKDAEAWARREVKAYS